MAALLCSSFEPSEEQEPSRGPLLSRDPHVHFPKPLAGYPQGAFGWLASSVPISFLLSGMESGAPLLHKAPSRPLPPAPPDPRFPAHVAVRAGGPPGAGEPGGQAGERPRPPARGQQESPQPAFLNGRRGAA